MYEVAMARSLSESAHPYPTIVINWLLVYSGMVKGTILRADEFPNKTLYAKQSTDD
jgi:hypothetical protein